MHISYLDWPGRVLAHTLPRIPVWSTVHICLTQAPNQQSRLAAVWTQSAWDQSLRPSARCWGSNCPCSEFLRRKAEQQQTHLDQHVPSAARHLQSSTHKLKLMETNHRNNKAGCAKLPSTFYLCLHACSCTRDCSLGVLSAHSKL